MLSSGWHRWIIARFLSGLIASALRTKTVLNCQPPILAWRPLTSASIGPVGLRPPEKTSAIPSIACRFHVLAWFAPILASRSNANGLTKPALFELYSLIFLWACELFTEHSMPHAAAWYRETNLTFSDAIGVVRLRLWVCEVYRHSPQNTELPEIPPDRLIRMADAISFAA